MAASLGPLVGAIDQGTSSTRFLVSTAQRSGRHRGRAAPPRPEGSQGFRAFTALHPGRGLYPALGEGQGNGPQGRAALSRLQPPVSRRSGAARPGAAGSAAVPQSRSRPSRGERSRGEPDISDSATAPGGCGIPLLRAGCACNLSGFQSVRLSICRVRHPEWNQMDGVLRHWGNRSCELGDCD